MRRTVTVERTFAISGAHVRLSIVPAGPGRARVVEAYRRAPGSERASRVKRLELEAPIEQFHLDESTLAQLDALRGATP